MSEYMYATSTFITKPLHLVTNTAVKMALNNLYSITIVLLGWFLYDMLHYQGHAHE